ncbi:hypothetical protein BOTBODRAFT_35657 [Botryobasidium botryosum FD-172 SS1]|uniref:F-box domain-containing protein n=1 Tax=Botryobasidium botryosum (strain FD-172 SS1) TaxID=930990 RepID=A0A067M6C8_BOTB1|nr:hypothetical protein BOTBODRAFT_35657 [Botryobasidium botryosum FD-172 SS1]
MQDVALDTLPRFITSLCERAYYNQAEGRAESVAELCLHLSPTIQFNTPDANAAEHADGALDALALACTYAVSAITSYTRILLSTARTHRNSRSLIYRLPDEVLSIIFEFTQSSAINPACGLKAKAPFNLSLVSRRWRGVALNPALWTVIDRKNARIANLYLQRSGSRLLDIDLLSYNQSYYWFSGSDIRSFAFDIRPNAALTARNAGRVDHGSLLTPLFSHIERCRTLALEGLRHYDVVHLGLPHAPNLKSLRLFNSADSFVHWKPLHEPFLQRPPNLSILELYNFPLPFTSSMFVGLKEMYIRTVAYSRRTAQGLIGILAACPLLEKVELDSVCLASSLAPTPEFEPILLPHLEKMALLWMDSSVVRVILSSVIAPPTLRLEIRTTDNASGLGMVSPQVTALPNIHAVKMLFFRIGPGTEQFGLTGRASEDGVDLLKFDFHFPPELAAFSKARKDVMFYLGQDLLNLPLHRLSFLQIYDDQMNGLAYVQTIGDASALTVLSLDECDAPEFLEVFIATPTIHLYPSLQALHLRQPHVRKDTLIRLVDSRQPQLSYIKIVQCEGVDEDVVSELRNVIEVSWEK